MINDMKLLIVRSYGSVMNLNEYNSQELGLAKAFRKIGVKADIVLFGGNKENHIDKIYINHNEFIKIYWLKGYAVLKHGVMESLWNVVKGYDRLWLNEFNQYTSWNLYKKFDGPVYLYHGPYLPKYSFIRMVHQLFAEWFFFRKKDIKKYPVFVKSSLAEKYIRYRGFQDVHVVGVGVDLSVFNYLSRDVSLKNYNNILYVGTFDNRKNTLFLVHLLKKITEKHPCVRLTLVGNGSRSYLAMINETARKLGVFDKINILAPMNQKSLKDIYDASGIFLLPSKYEIFGMVLLEAMSFGNIVVSTTNGGSSTIIQDGVNGYICDGNVDEWNYIIDKILSDPIKSKIISINAASMITDGFSWDSIARKAMKIISLEN